MDDQTETTDDALIGQSVRWSDEEHFPGMWFTARIVKSNGWGGYVGECLHPGNFRDNRGAFRPGELVPNLRPNLIAPLTEED